MYEPCTNVDIPSVRHRGTPSTTSSVNSSSGTITENMDPSFSGPNVSDEPSLQTLFVDGDSERLEAAVRYGMTLLDRLREPLCRLSSDVDESQWLQAIKYLQKQAVHPKVIIGVVGNTGAGKSSIINAVLDEERLVPTNCMRACTAVVTEISYNHEETPYRAEIEFITANDWAKELQILLDELLGVGGILLVTIAYAKIKAVYPSYTKNQLENSTISKLIEHPNVQKVLGRVESVVETNSKQFYKNLQTYVDSREKMAQEKDTTDQPLLDMEVWPLIKVVRIYVKATALSTGAVIVDLPGVHDSNPARAAVSKSYLKQCTGLWIVAPITRAVDDKAAKYLLGGGFKRQLKMDGGLNSITFICSKTDDISLLECQECLGLEKQMGALRGNADEHLNKKHQSEQHLDELKKAMADSTAAADEIDRQVEELETFQGNIRDGETVSKKRKRGSNCGISSALPKTPRLVHSDFGDYHVDSDGGDELDEDPVESQTFSNPLTAGEVDQKLSELRATKKEGRHYRQDIKIGMETAQRQISDSEIVIASIQAKINELAISSRNEYSRSAIQKDFAAGIKELDQELAEESDSSRFNPDADDRDYDEVARSLPVFCISSRAYQKLKGRFEMEPTIPGFRTVEDTEVPQLQVHCRKLTEASRDANSRRFLNSLDQLLNSLRLMSSADGNQATDEQKTVWANTLESNYKVLYADLAELIRDICERVRNTIECNIFTAYKDAVEAATNKADETVKRWGRKVNRDNRAVGGFFWSTYKAICRRDGVYANEQGTHDWNAELTEPVLKAVASGWENTFSQRAQSLLLSMASEGARLLQSFHDSVHHTADQNTSRIGNHVLSQQLRVYQQLLKGLCLENLTMVTTRSKDISRMFQPVVAEKLAPVYANCTALSGPGSFNQMKEVMSSFVNRAKSTMFQESVDTVRKALGELLRFLEDNLTIKVDEMLISVKRDYTSALGRNYSAVSKCLLRLILDIITESESYFKRLANAELERDITIADTELAPTSPPFSLSSPNYSPSSPDLGHQSPTFSPGSPTYNPTGPTISDNRQFPPSPQYSPRSLGWSPTSPEIYSTTSSNISGFSTNTSPNEEHELSFAFEAETARFDLFRSLVNQPIDDEEWREIYRLGDRIISDTAIVLNDLEGWLWEDFQQHGVVLPSCHNLPSAKISTSMFRFLMETNNDRQRKSVYRRLAQVLFFVFVENDVKQLDKREKNGEVIAHNHRNFTGMAHKSILQEIGDLSVNGKNCSQEQISNNKSCGKRWWRLGSGTGIIVILAGGPGVARYMYDITPCIEKLGTYVILGRISLDDIIQPLLVNASLTTNHIIDWTDQIDPLHLQFNVLPETIEWVDTQIMMDTATESLLYYFEHCD
ncbi:hypothetical protein BGW36DRAFT_437369 [Talaromyces proteolyticus]|uniref:Uncharacterized protein n=1 Tax=Talaromyces proteolyticus TaxID=1131652 RepID=A0AAD4PU43_9EURO|nr:uncharacterized protein BGW36DRAFT_437369 [Talaromyces proteolyticus]KAH8691825.1 hypothetical protein BGW36DRAFT_437369 [Talaromyces proteolyticus]